MPSTKGIVVILATGGTIAGTATSAVAHLGYTSGALSAQDLIDAVPALQGQLLEAETLARLDSCDMDHATWALLAERVAQHLARAEVVGVVITHGTDTLEETAFFLHRVVDAGKPVVLTAAMRPATAPSADGPQNLLDAVTVAREGGASGVLAVLQGRIHAGGDVRKVHGYAVDAFSSGDAGPLGLLEDGRVRTFRAWPRPALHASAARLGPPQRWPIVDLVFSHAGGRAAGLRALVKAGARGVVIAGTGNGTVHAELLVAARAAVVAGVAVRRASRCILGGVVIGNAEAHQLDELSSYGPLTPVQARIELMLDLS